MTDATGFASYIYDPFGELTSAINGASQTVGYGYDAGGNTTSVTYPLPASATWANTPTVAYGYDHAGTLTSVTDFNSHQITITPNADSLPATQTLGTTGDTITYTYDPTGTPSTITLSNSSTTLQSFTYADAPAGTILSETDTPTTPASPAAYTYDAKGRVTSMTPGSGSALNYGFDASSNLTTLPTGATGTYDNASELTSSVQSATTSYTYNPGGQQLSARQGTTTTASATWNGAGQLTSYTNPAATMTAATYDGTGLRATATTTAGTQNYTWDTAGNLLMDSANAYIYTGTGAPAEQVSLAAGTISYLGTDSLGSVRAIISPAGALTASTSYDAWGNPQTTGGLTASTPFGYAGAYTDPTGLLYLINRYYNPATGQFLSVDPALSATQEPYSYADGNPVSNTDPTGLCAQSWCPPPTYRGTSPPPRYGPGTSTVVYGFNTYNNPPRTPAQRHTPPSTSKHIRKAATSQAVRARRPAPAPRRPKPASSDPAVFSTGASIGPTT
jgi:RHS repeat-associated protein